MHGYAAAMGMNSFLRAGLLAGVSAAVSAQAPTLGKRAHFDLEVVTVDAGKQARRIDEPLPGEAACLAFTMVGRQLEWRFGEQRFRDLEALRAALWKASNDERKRRESPDPPEERRPLPLVVRFDDRVRWCEVVSTLDVARESAFLEVHLFGGKDFEPQFEACAVADPVRANCAHVVPRAIFSEPDDQRLKFRPVLTVAQDGRVEYEGVCVFDPKAPDGGKALTAVLAKCARRDDNKFGTRRFGEHGLELSNNYLLIHADLWAPWPVVHMISRIATEVTPPLYQLQYATGSADYEPRLRAGERFLAPAADGERARR